MESTADRHMWAIEQGKEFEANPYQRAVLVYIAFRSGPDNDGAWQNRDTITLETGMHKNTITRALSWWVDRGVLQRTRRQHGTTIYQLIQENLTGSIDTSRPVAASHAYEPDNSGPEPESNRTSEVLSIEPVGVPIEPLECSNRTSERPLKERKDNINEQDETNNTQLGMQELREFLGMLPEPRRETAIQEALERYPDLQGSPTYYLVNWEQFKTDLLAVA